jgi:hypothetical protein
MSAIEPSDLLKRSRPLVCTKRRCGGFRFGANEFPNAISGLIRWCARNPARTQTRARDRVALATLILGKLLKLRLVGVASILMCCATAAHATEINDFKLLKFGGTSVRWRNVTPGQAPMVSYGIVSETREFIDASNCRKLSSLDWLAATSQLSGEVIRREIDSAFAMWQAAANINFRAAETPLTADILIGAEVEPAGWAFANVSYGAGFKDRPKPISQSLICPNPLEAVEGRL